MIISSNYDTIKFNFKFHLDLPKILSLVLVLETALDTCFDLEHKCDFASVFDPVDDPVVLALSFVQFSVVSSLRGLHSHSLGFLESRIWGMTGLW